jgi:hypothetical protein
MNCLPETVVPPPSPLPPPAPRTSADSFVRCYWPKRRGCEKSKIASRVRGAQTRKQRCLRSSIAALHVRLISKLRNSHSGTGAHTCTRAPQLIIHYESHPRTYKQSVWHWCTYGHFCETLHVYHAIFYRTLRVAWCAEMHSCATMPKQKR